MNISKLNICEGCLSVDRNLVNFSEDLSKLFSILLEKDHSVINLCWECEAYMKRFMRFKKQVKRAHDTLSQLMPNIQPLTNLKITECNNVRDVYNYEVTFVKIEEHVENYDDVCDNIELLKSEPIECDTENVDDKSIDDFNDSDDEPLNTKREKTNDEENEVKDEKEKSVVVNNTRVSKKLRQLNVSNEHIEMVVLTWDEVKLERQKALESDAFKRPEYKCHECAVGFNHRCKLERHMKKHAVESGTFECTLCHVRCRHERALAAHVRRHRARWRCRYCGGTWSRAALCADHATREHRAPAPTHTCWKCGHTEATLGKLRNHVKNHFERQKCEQCGKTFRDKTSLKTHLFIHRGEKEYSCSQCDKKFLFKKAMEIHMITHDAPAHLYCYQCDMNFKNQMSYNQHMKYNLKHIDPAKLKYACKLCDKKFLKAVRLEEHNMAVHLKMTPIKCTVVGCNFSCSSKPVLRSHTRSCHHLTRRARNHVCHVCGNAYTSKKSLAGHLNSHAGARPLRCSRCPASFAYDAALYNHSRLVHREQVSSLN